MNTFFRIIAVLTVLPLLSGCCKDHPSLPQEEIMCHNWRLTNKDMSCSLRFSDDRLVLDASLPGNKKLSLSGCCYADEKSLTVESVPFGTVVFPYRIENEFLYLGYAGKELRLQKENSGTKSK